MNYEFLDKKGTFTLQNAENVSYLYFPIAGEQGVKSALTPLLSGDCKTGQNQFLLQPVSAEELHNNKSSRNFWCHIQGEEGGLWSASGVSAKQESLKFTKQQEPSSMTAGFMWHQVERTSEKYGLQAVITSFVPVCCPNVEVMQVTIRNQKQDAVVFTPVGAIPIFGRSADNLRDHRHVTSLLHTIQTTQCGVEVTPTLSFDERGHQRNHTTYFVYGATGEGEAPAGFYPVVEDFIGEGGSFLHPAGLLNNVKPEEAGVSLAGYEAMGGIVFAETVLNPGEAKDFILLMGITEDKAFDLQAAKVLMSKEKSQRALKETKEFWAKKVNVSVHTQDEKFGQFMHWVSFQPELRRIFGCSFLPHHDYGKGGRGFRDLWQDCLALLIMNPDGVREMLINNFAGIRMDGTNATIIGSKPGEFIADRNSITRVWMDHGVWPLITTAFYINQTGDLGILLKQAPYFKDKQVMRGTQTDNLWEETLTPILRDGEGREYQGTILEHLLLQNLTAFYEVGEHNHIRLRGADWNDAIDMAPDRGESVAFTAAYAGNLSTLAGLLVSLRDEMGMERLETAKEMEILFQDDDSLYEDISQKQKLLDEYCRSCFHEVSGEKVYLSIEDAIVSLKKKADWIKKHIRETEWVADEQTGGWFNGYYDNHGKQVEGHYNGMVRMMLTSQVFTVMSGTATEEQVRSIVNSADQYLYEEAVGGYRLNTDFHELKTDMGRMFGFAYGHKENGAVFSHMTTMYANALYQRGFVKEGFRALDTLYRQAVNFPVSRIYPGIPEYFNDRGRGMYHYLTGAASWYMLTVVTEMFGIKGRLGNLCMEPKLLKEQFNQDKKAEISLRFGGYDWHVIYVNEQEKEFGSYQISEIFLNGENLELKEDKGCIPKERIRTLDTQTVHEVIVILN